MEIENHKEEVPFAFYEEKFRALHPEDVTGEEDNQPDETLEEDATGAIEKESEEN